MSGNPAAPPRALAFQKMAKVVRRLHGQERGHVGSARVPLGNPAGHPRHRNRQKPDELPPDLPAVAMRHSVPQHQEVNAEMAEEMALTENVRPLKMRPRPTCIAFKGQFSIPGQFEEKGVPQVHARN